MRPPGFDITLIIEALRGTADSIDTVACRVYELEEFDFTADCTAAELSILDNEIFECAECGWWCEMSEVSTHNSGDDGDYCKDCQPETDEDE
jgi:hypothetical protein